MFDKVSVIPESDYARIMKETAEPYLRERGDSECYFVSRDGNSLHYEHYRAEAPRGAVVICHGFTESAEKFREMSYYFLLMGLNVYVLEHRGHGKSFRYNFRDPETVHINGFGQYVDDLHAFTERVVIPGYGGGPLFLYSHSMGGAIAVQYLQTHPSVYTAAVLSAPMIKPQTWGIPSAAALTAVGVLKALGRGSKAVSSKRGFDPGRSFESSHDTSKARFDYYHAKRCADVRYQTSSPSASWVKEAVKVASLNLDPERCRAITEPVLLFQPEEDSSVVTEKEDEFIALVPKGKLVRLKDCKHEIYMSVDPTVQTYLDIMTDFFNKP